MSGHSGSTNTGGSQQTESWALEHTRDLDFCTGGGKKGQVRGKTQIFILTQYFTERLTSGQSDAGDTLIGALQQDTHVLTEAVFTPTRIWVRVSR